jgi:hypothetical protein
MDLFSDKRFRVILAGFPLAALLGYYGLEIATTSIFYYDSKNLELLKAYGTLVSTLGLSILFFLCYIFGVIFLNLSGIFFIWREIKYHKQEITEEKILLLSILLCSIISFVSDYFYRTYFHGKPVQFGLGLIVVVCFLFFITIPIKKILLNSRK